MYDYDTIELCRMHTHTYTHARTSVQGGGRTVTYGEESHPGFHKRAEMALQVGLNHPWI